LTGRRRGGLSRYTCHLQTIIAQARNLVLWWSLLRIGIPAMSKRRGRATVRCMPSGRAKCIYLLETCLYLSPERSWCPCSVFLVQNVNGVLAQNAPVHGMSEGRCKATSKKIFELPRREAGPPDHHDDEVDSDQQVVNKKLSL
jgi:hypothetical protein